MRPTLLLKGGGGHFPYPREVWSPSGGWWAQPRNWKSNTAVVVLGTAFLAYGIFNLSSMTEERLVPPTRWIPSMSHSKQAKEIGVRDE